METPNSRPNLSNIIAACIVAAGLLGAARIVANRPATNSQNVASAPVVVSPPLSQETIRRQVRTQVLAAHTLRTFRFRNTVYTLADVTVTQVSYQAKEDVFTVQFDWVWRPTMPLGGFQRDLITLHNNGYGEYCGPAVLSPIVGGTGQNADICVK